jgi:hypothetical protein
VGKCFIDIPCSKFSFKELKVAIVKFSSSKFKSHQAKYYEDSLTRVVHSPCFAQKAKSLNKMLGSLGS